MRSGRLVRRRRRAPRPAPFPRRRRWRRRPSPLIQAAPRIFGEVIGEISALIAAGVLAPVQPTVYDLADGPKALTELEARATVGKLALLP